MESSRILVDIEKVNQNIESLNSKLDTHKQQLTKLQKGKKGFKNDYKVSMKENHIKSTKSKIEKELVRLEKLKERYRLELAKEDLLIKESPEILISFTNKWKELAFDWHIHNYKEHLSFCKNLKNEQTQAIIECIETSDEYSKYRDENGKAKDYYVRDYLNLSPRNIMNDFLKNQKLDYRSVKARILKSTTIRILRMKDFKDEQERLEWLNKVLERERKQKLLDLFNRIYKVTGKIIDGTDLKINEKGNLDGIVKGEVSNVKVETVGAGGYNIQCFHFRTLVKKLK